MIISPQQFRAYANGELRGEEARAVEEAIAADPDLAARLEKVRRAKGKVRPLPISTARPTRADGATAHEGAILDFTAARARRAQASTTKERRRPAAAPQGRVPIFQRPGLALGLSLALVLGVMIGTSLDIARFADTSGQGTGNVRDAGDGLLAAGPLATALERQARASPQDERLFHITATYRRKDGTYCRRFAGSIGTGLACRVADTWKLIALHSDPGADLAQTGLQLGQPLSAKAEAEALSTGWP